MGVYRDLEGLGFPKCRVMIFGVLIRGLEWGPPYLESRDHISVGSSRRL